MTMPLIGVLGGRLLIQSANPIERASIDERLWLVGVGWQEFLAHPWLGTGVGNFALVSLHDGLQGQPPEPVHDVPLLVVVEAGAPGIIALATLAWLGFRALRRPEGWFAARLAVTAALAPLAAFDHYLWTMGEMRVLVCLLAVVISGARAHPRSDWSSQTVGAHGFRVKPDADAIAVLDDLPAA
jgi:O-antigen ligase